MAICPAVSFASSKLSKCVFRRWATYLVRFSSDRNDVQPTTTANPVDRRHAGGKCKLAIAVQDARTMGLWRASALVARTKSLFTLLLFAWGAAVVVSTRSASQPASSDLRGKRGDFACKSPAASFFFFYPFLCRELSPPRCSLAQLVAHTAPIIYQLIRLARRWLHSHGPRVGTACRLASNYGLGGAGGLRIAYVPRLLQASHHLVWACVRCSPARCKGDGPISLGWQTAAVQASQSPNAIGKGSDRWPGFV